MRIVIIIITTTSEPPPIDPTPDLHRNTAFSAKTVEEVLEEDLDIHLQTSPHERQFEMLEYCRVQDAESTNLLRFPLVTKLEEDGCCMAGEVGRI